MRWPLILSGLAWAVLAASHRGWVLPAMCGGRLQDPLAALDQHALVFALNPLPMLALGWLTMSTAMMLPMVAPQLDHIAARARPGQVQGLLGFLLTYLGFWTLLCGGLAMASLILVAGDPRAAIVLAGLGLLWQQSRWKALALRRCVARPAMRWEGLGLMADGAAYGWASARTCFASCWPWMALAMASDNLIVMGLAAGLLMYERFVIQHPLGSVFPGGWIRTAPNDFVPSKPKHQLRVT